MFTWNKRVGNQEFLNVPCSDHCQQTFKDVGATQLKPVISGLLTSEW